MFNSLKFGIERYLSLCIPSRKVRCVETVQIFKSASGVCLWVEFIRETNYCNKDLIKQCCRGKQKTLRKYENLYNIEKYFV